jgi:hypothetical protein
MKKLVITLLLLTLSTLIHAQKEKELDSVIVLQVTDTTNLYNRIKWSMINQEFIVKDLPSRDTLKTYAREFLNNDFMIVSAVIKGDEIKFSGIWGSRKLSWFGYSLSPNDYKRILFYKGCVEWRIMKRIAEGVGGILSFQ